MIVFHYYDKCIELKQLTYADWIKNPSPRRMYVWYKGANDSIVSINASVGFVTEMLPDGRIRSYWEGYESKKEAEFFQGKGCFMDFCAEIPSGTVTAKNFYRELKLFERIRAYKGLNISSEVIMERLMINMFKNNPHFSKKMLQNIRTKIDEIKHFF